MKLLITDILFPNKYSTWRNEEINYFLKNEDTSILVFKVDFNETHRFSFDFGFCNRDELLNGYNILIFDPRYNEFNRFNTKIDGTKFNGLYNASYLITKDDSFDVSSFDTIYHIFSDCYIKFNNRFSFPIKKQLLHLYPGGGFNVNDPLMYNKEINLICTHPSTTQFARVNNYVHVDCWTGPLLNEDYVYPNRIDLLTKNKLTVCFASMGNPLFKGFYDYLKIAELYKKRYPKDEIEFISIGGCETTEYNKNHESTDYLSLQKFYKENVDIYINMENGMAPNGWPLGLESLIMGSVLLTRDVWGSYKKYEINKDSIQVCDTIDEFIDKIKQLYINRLYLYTLSQNNNEFISRYISMDNQQYKIHTFMKNVLSMVS